MFEYSAEARLGVELGALVDRLNDLDESVRERALAYWNGYVQNHIRALAKEENVFKYTAAYMRRNPLVWTHSADAERTVLLFTRNPATTFDPQYSTPRKGWKVFPVGVRRPKVKIGDRFVTLRRYQEHSDDLGAGTTEPLKNMFYGSNMKGRDTRSVWGYNVAGELQIAVSERNMVDVLYKDHPTRVDSEVYAALERAIDKALAEV